jgi:hypothetical protein
MKNPLFESYAKQIRPGMTPEQVSKIWKEYAEASVKAKDIPAAKELKKTGGENA